MTTPSASERGFVNEILRAADRRAEEIVRANLPAIRYGVVDAIDAANRKATVQLPGPGSSSPGFVYPPTMTPVVGDLVRVVLLPTGDRYVDEVYPAAFAAPLRFVPINRVVVLNSTTTVSIARTLSGAISGVPADAVLVAGYMSIASDGTANFGNWMGLYQTESGTNDLAVQTRPAGVGSAFTTATGFVCGVVQSGGAKISYVVERSTGTVSYFVGVTGYWTPST